MFLFKRIFECGVGREQNIANYYLFKLKLLFQSELYITFLVICVIKMVFFLNFVDNLLKDLTREQIGEKIQSRPWLNVRSKMIYNLQSTDK